MGPPESVSAEAGALGSRRRSRRRVNSAKPAIATATTAMATSQRLRSPPIIGLGLLQVHDQQRRPDQRRLEPEYSGSGSAPTEKRVIYASSACPSVSAESDAALRNDDRCESREMSFLLTNNAGSPAILRSGRRHKDPPDASGELCAASDTP